VKLNQAIAQAIAHTITPNTPNNSPVVMPVLEISAQTAGMPRASRGTWSVQVTRAFAVASMYPPEKAIGISSVETINKPLRIAAPTSHDWNTQSEARPSQEPYRGFTRSGNDAGSVIGDGSRVNAAPEARPVCDTRSYCIRGGSRRNGTAAENR
jgi:hypothetical protein